MISKSLILLPRQPKSGTRIIAMGLMAILKREVQDVAFFKPIVGDAVENDDDIQFFKQYFKLKQDPSTAYGLTITEAKKLITHGKTAILYENILERFQVLEKEYDFVLCAGLGSDLPSELFDFDLDIHIAENLQIPSIMILNAYEKETLSQIQEDIDFAIGSVSKHHIETLALFITRLSTKLLPQATEALKSKVPLLFLPEVAQLEQPTMIEIMEQTQAKLLSRDSTMLDRMVKQSKVAAMNLEHYLNYLEEGDLIIVPGDRADILVGTFLANLSHSYPSLAGVLLTGGMQPPHNITSLIEGADIPILPMIGVDTDTQTAALMVQNVSPAITLHSERKIALAQGLFREYVNPNIIKERLFLTQPKTMTPVRFSYMLYEKARAAKSHILLPESDDERILRAADIILRRGLCKITFLGNPKKIAQKSSLLGLDLSKAHIVDPSSWEHMEEFVETFYQLRKHKGIIKAMAREIVSRTNYFATMMLYMGYVDGVVSGATHTTRETIKPAFEVIKMQEGVQLISSLFFMLLENNVLVYGDCAVNPDPNAEELAQIALSCAQTAQTFGIEPRVAMLSYSSGDSGVGADVEKVREATRRAKALDPDLIVEGPMQYDAAVDAQVAAQKMPDSKVAGKATIFIFPDLNTGNNTYKAVQRSADAIAIGPILQGLKKPVNDLSRGCLVEDIVHTVAITAIQAAEVKR